MNPAERTRIWRKENPERYGESVKRQNEKQKEAARKRIGTCEICGLTFPAFRRQVSVCLGCMKERERKKGRESNLRSQKNNGRESHNRAARKYARKKYWELKRLREEEALNQLNNKD